MPASIMHEIRVWSPNENVTPLCRQPRPSRSSQSVPISVKFLPHLHLHRLPPDILPSYHASPSNDVPLPFSGCARSLLSLAPAFYKSLPLNQAILATLTSQLDRDSTCSRLLQEASSIRVVASSLQQCSHSPNRKCISALFLALNGHLLALKIISGHNQFRCRLIRTALYLNDVSNNIVALLVVCVVVDWRHCRPSLCYFTPC